MIGYRSLESVSDSSRIVSPVISTSSLSTFFVNLKSDPHTLPNLFEIFRPSRAMTAAACLNFAASKPVARI